MPPLGAGASACASSSVLSKNSEPLPCGSTRNTLPSLPVPMNRVPSDSAIIDQRKGADVSKISSVAGASPFEDAEDRRRQRRQELAVDHRAGVGAEQLDVEGVVPAALVERLDHLIDASRLGAPGFALFGRGKPRAVGYENGQRSARV